MIEKHKKLVKEFQKMQQQLNMENTDGIVTDHDAIMRNLQFIMDEDVSKAQK